MKVPKRFKELKEDERRKYANRKKKEYERKVEFWTGICRKLSANKDFTPLEFDLIDLVLEKEE